MSCFGVWIVQAPACPHWQALVDAARGVVYSLRRLGHQVMFAPVEDAPLSTYGLTERLIVFNAHRLDPKVILRLDAIIFNSEQVQLDGEGGQAWRELPYLKLLQKHTVWDYSATNVERLRKLGVERVRLCPIGYYPREPLPPPSPGGEDVDVLFFGTMSPRRAMVAFDLAQRGLQVKTLFGVYGSALDGWISRSKVVLNMHYYPSPIFEIFRVAPLLAQRRCVVSEDGGADPALEELAAMTTLHTSYERLVEVCEQAVRDEALRKEMAARGQLAFMQHEQVAAVRSALEAT